jgi:hypothetical protein
LADRLLFLAEFPVTYTVENPEHSDHPKRVSVIFKIDCALHKTPNCAGVIVDQRNLAEGKPLSLLDITDLELVRWVSHSPMVSIVQWGTRRFIIDMNEGTVRYIESRPEGVEGRAVARCQP